MARKAKPASPFPATIGECADALYALKEQKAFMAAQLKSVTDAEAALKEHIINTLPKSNASGVAGRLARVRVGTKDVPSVTDWAKLQAYVRRTGEFELLGRSIAAAAVEERWTAGKKIPGVEPFKAVKVYINKL